MHVKTLVVLLGSARGGEETWNSLYTYLISPLSADLALLFGKTDLKTSSLYSRAKYVWEIDEYDDWWNYLSIEDCKGEVWSVIRKATNSTKPCNGCNSVAETS